MTAEQPEISEGAVTRAERAAEWLVALLTTQQPPSLETTARFLHWINESAAHLLLFMEHVESERRLRRLDEASIAVIRAAINHSR
jgi:hypothetical protein